MHMCMHTPPPVQEQLSLLARREALHGVLRKKALHLALAGDQGQSGSDWRVEE